MLEGGDEAVFVERLAECRNVCRDVISQEVIAVASDEHEWQATAGCAHLLAQLQSVQTRQPDIQDDAVEAVAVAGKFFSGGKEPNLMAHRTKKPVQSGAHIDVVIDDGEGHGGGVYHRHRGPGLSHVKVQAGRLGYRLQSGSTVLGRVGTLALPFSSSTSPTLLPAGSLKTARTTRPGTSKRGNRIGAASLLHLCQRRRDVVDADVDDRLGLAFADVGRKRRPDGRHQVATRRDRPLEEPGIEALKLLALRTKDAEEDDRCASGAWGLRGCDRWNEQGTREHDVSNHAGSVAKRAGTRLDVSCGVQSKGGSKDPPLPRPRTVDRGPWTYFTSLCVTSWTSCFFCAPPQPLDLDRRLLLEHLLAIEPLHLHVLP